MKKFKSKKGMTLVELVVTIAILSIVSGMGVGIFSATIRHYSTASVTAKEQQDATLIEDYIKQYAITAKGLSEVTGGASSTSGVYIEMDADSTILDIYVYDSATGTKSTQMSFSGVKSVSWSLKLIQPSGSRDPDNDYFYMYYTITMGNGYSVKGSIMMKNTDASDTTVYGYGTSGYAVEQNSGTVGDSSTKTALCFET